MPKYPNPSPETIREVLRYIGNCRVNAANSVSTKSPLGEFIPICCGGCGRVEVAQVSQISTSDDPGWHNAVVEFLGQRVFTHSENCPTPHSAPHVDAGLFGVLLRPVQ